MRVDATAPLGRWQRVYTAAHAWRRRYWARRAVRLPRPVISVGNLAWGGSGKTPLVAAIAGHLGARGLHVAVLSRGYGSRGRGVRLAQLPTAPGDPARVGDEPAMLAALLPGTPVVVHPRRAEAGRWALAHLDPPPEVFLLDDGFSHLALARDLDLLACPAEDPLAGGRLWPGGRLREPLASARHADAVLLTGRSARREQAEELAAGLAGTGFAGPVFLAPTRVLAPHRDDGTPLATGEPVLLVTGVARPAAVRRSAEALGIHVADHLALPDHEPYPPRRLRQIATRAAACRAGVVLTTAKDAVKLRHRLAVPLAVLGIEAAIEPAFFAFLDHRLEPLLGPPRP